MPSTAALRLTLALSLASLFVGCSESRPTPSGPTRPTTRSDAGTNPTESDSGDGGGAAAIDGGAAVDDGGTAADGGGAAADGGGAAVDGGTAADGGGVRPCYVSCGGCCDANGQCLPGDSDASCGASGRSCRVCTPGNSVCAGQVCQLVTSLRFGNWAPHDSFEHLDPDELQGIRVHVDVPAVVTAVGVELTYNFGLVQLRGAVYADAAGGPGQLLGRTAEATSQQVSELPLVRPISVAAGDYWVMVVADHWASIGFIWGNYQPYCHASLPFTSAFPQAFPPLGPRAICTTDSRYNMYLLAHQ